MSEPDKGFFDRADGHIALANAQISKEVGPGEVSASFLFAAARYNAFITAAGCTTSLELQSSKEQAVDYFTEQFRALLEQQMDDYAQNFSVYMRQRGK